MSRYVIGDVHGQFDGLMLLLNQINLTADDQLFFLGDLIDRGAQSADVVDWVIKNQHSCILGNHEQMCIEAFSYPNSSAVWQGWLINGGSRTLESYSSSEMLEAHLEWMQNLPLYLDLGDFWLVHAGLNPKLEINAQSSTEFCWIREPFHRSKEPYFANKTIITGHTITFVFPGLNAGDIAQGAGWLGIDTGAYHPKSGWLTALNIDTSTVYQINTFTNAVRSLPLSEVSVSVLDKSGNKSKRRLVNSY
ncbi:Calcineurin-like phosphoesterase [Synechococcus sp. PCC 7502]|uniref:metallophosphoesterase family protein n=1 Tax=Synechococcus sp. PCC 7502 TaxID=1173263 RepID=UPI00029FFD7A|nr:metallophosphoesterase family protein [Synechococcus sp. PCC 7502]AFY74553.1 Calcineurin-like phosphoesterase [Synechococcus sp. PCC 7502]